MNERSITKHHLAILTRFVCDERGVELVEFLGFFPFILLTLVFAWQYMLVGYTGLIASSAAREAARAAATHEDIYRAAENASPGFDDRRDVRPIAGYPCAGNNPVTIDVMLEAPHVTFPFVGALGAYPQVTQRATVRCEPEPTT